MLHIYSKYQPTETLSKYILCQPQIFNFVVDHIVTATIEWSIDSRKGLWLSRPLPQESSSNGGKGEGVNEKKRVKWLLPGRWGSVKQLSQEQNDIIEDKEKRRGKGGGAEEEEEEEEEEERKEVVCWQYPVFKSNWNQ